MEVILSLSAWCDFIFTRLLKDAIFPVIVLMLVFALINRKEYKNTNAKLLRFILTALVVSLISRYMFFVHMNTKINTRYLYTGAFYVIILCVPGFPAALCFLKRLTKKIPWVREKHLTVFLLLLISIACIGKALHPPSRKFYIQDTAKIINGSEAPVPPLLISNLRDARRVAWHSKAELLPLSSVINIDNPVYFASALKTLSSKNRNIFLFVKSRDAEFRKCFSNKKIKFPEGLILLKEFKAKHKKFYSLYKVNR